MKYILSFLLFTLPLAGLNLSRPLAHLHIGDPQEALKELQPLLENNPENPSLKRLELICLARSNEITSMLKKFTREFSDDREILEEVAWAIIRKASASHSPFIRQTANMAAFLANDAKSIPLCLQGMRDQSEQARLLALHLAARSRDEELLVESHRLLLQDHSPRVRELAIMTLGSQRYAGACASLEKILESPDATANQKCAAIHALTNIVDRLDPEMIKKLVCSKRAILRQFACQLVLEHGDREALQSIIALINDPSFEVRQAAIQCAGVLSAQIESDALDRLLSHQDIKTNILANWLALVLGYEPDATMRNLKRYLLSDERQVRLNACAAIIHSGKQAARFSACLSNPDPYVRLNIAMALLWQQVDVDIAAETILKALQDEARLSMHSAGIFSYVAQSHATHVGGYARLPESEDLFVRLELLSMCACASKTSLKKPLKALLQDRTWGISGQTAAFMMQEELLYIDELQELLQDTNSDIALQAAFILAIFSKDEGALQVLQKAYKSASRQKKEFILYAIGAIGDAAALPFLVSVLNEPFESLRVIGARSILICLYH